MLLALILVTVYAIKYATESQVQALKEETLLHLKYMQDQLSLVPRFTKKQTIRESAKSCMSGAEKRSRNGFGAITETTRRLGVKNDGRLRKPPGCSSHLPQQQSLTVLASGLLTFDWSMHLNALNPRSALSRSDFNMSRFLRRLLLTFCCVTAQVESLVSFRSRRSLPVGKSEPP